MSVVTGAKKASTALKQHVACHLLTCSSATGLNVSKYTWRLTSKETMRLIRDGKKGGGGGMEAEEEGDYTPIAMRLSPPE